MKFGGTSVADAERIRACTAIVAARRSLRPVVVVSALAGVTDRLQQAFACAGRGEHEALEPLLADVERRNRWAISGSVDGASERHDLALEIDRMFEELRQLLRAIRVLGECNARAADAVLAFGEAWSARIVCAAMQGSGLSARRVDPREVMITDDRFGRAEPDLEAIARSATRLVKPLLDAGEIPVLGGFVGATADGRTTTLGRGGSDTTAAVLGAALGADEIQIWTDVDGLMSADPRLVPAARTIPRVSFAEAAELAYYGAKVLHPDSIAPAVRRKIPVRVLNSMRPLGGGTVIVDDANDDASSECVSVASRRGVQTLRFVAVRMRADPQFLPRVASALAACDVVPDLLTCTEMAVGAVIPEAIDVAAVAAALGPGYRIEDERGRALLCVVGAGLASSADARARVLDALARWAPSMLSAGASGSSIGAVVAADRLEDAVRDLHARFFESRRQEVVS